jgi:hypothetical protein
MVNSAWRQAAKDRLLYDTRLAACRLSRCVVINCTQSDNVDDHHLPSIHIFSTTANCDERLPIPAIPWLDKKFPYDCACIALEGRLYVLGGSDQRSPVEKNDGFLGIQQPSTNKAYVLDMAAHGQWEQLEPMIEARANFTCAVSDGKIYVFGGTGTGRGRRWVETSEVYDPSINAWRGFRGKRLNGLGFRSCRLKD